MEKIGLLAVLFLAGCGNGYEYGSGFQSGELQKLSKHGIFCKTWEGQIIMNGVKRSASSPITNFWEFTMKDDRLANELTQLSEACKNIRLSYTERGLSSICNGDTNFIVHAVKCESAQ